jgi:hypothetical protein
MLVRFYRPNQLPPSYNRWIATLARMDPRLLVRLLVTERRSNLKDRNTNPPPSLLFCAQELLQYARRGEYVYGKKPHKEVELMCEGIAGALGRDPR